MRRGRDEDGEEDGVEGQGREVWDAVGGVVASGQERRGGGGGGRGTLSSTEKKAWCGGTTPDTHDILHGLRSQGRSSP